MSILLEKKYNEIAQPKLQYFAIVKNLVKF